LFSGFGRNYASRKIRFGSRKTFGIELLTIQQVYQRQLELPTATGDYPQVRPSFKASKPELFAANFANSHEFLKPIRENSWNSRLGFCFFP
jgi:hypothetical protein